MHYQDTSNPIENIMPPASNNARRNLSGWEYYGSGLKQCQKKLSGWEYNASSLITLAEESIRVES